MTAYTFADPRRPDECGSCGFPVLNPQHMPWCPHASPAASTSPAAAEFPPAPSVGGVDGTGDPAVSVVLGEVATRNASPVPTSTDAAR